MDPAMTHSDTFEVVLTAVMEMQDGEHRQS
jgi:hypothetical protein